MTNVNLMPAHRQAPVALWLLARDFDASAKKIAATGAEAVLLPAGHELAARLSDALGDKPYLLGDFSIADIAMATVLREGVEAGLIAEYPRLAAYLDRCTGRPAFQRAMAAQLASFKEEPVTA